MMRGRDEPEEMLVVVVFARLDINSGFFIGDFLGLEALLIGLSSGPPKIAHSSKRRERNLPRAIRHNRFVNLMLGNCKKFVKRKQGNKPYIHNTPVMSQIEFPSSWRNPAFVIW